jgi:hypothetical protein
MERRTASQLGLIEFLSDIKGTGYDENSNNSGWKNEG